MTFAEKASRPPRITEGLIRGGNVRQEITGDNILSALDVLTAPKTPGGDPGEASATQIAAEIKGGGLVSGIIVDVFTLMPQLVEEGKVASRVERGDKLGEGIVLYQRVPQSVAVESANRTPQIPTSRRQRSLQRA